MKLNGETAKTKPSSGRYSSRFQTPGRRDGLLGVDARHELDVEAEEVDRARRPRRSPPGAPSSTGRASSPRSSVSRHGPASSSAARRKTAARSSHGQRDQSFHALAAASIACCDVLGRRPGGRRRARAPCRAASTAGRVVAGGDVLAADHERDLEALAAHLLEPRLQARALGAAGREVADRLVVAGRRDGRSRGCSWLVHYGCAGSAPEQVGRRDEHPDHEAERRGPEGRADERPVGRRLGRPRRRARRRRRRSRRARTTSAPCGRAAPRATSR